MIPDMWWVDWCMQKHVTNEAECRRRYGSHAKTKIVNGVVTSVETIRNGNNKRTATEITASCYTLGGSVTKVQRLNSRNVKAGHVADINSDNNEPVTELVTGNREPTQSTDDGGSAPVVGISTEQMLAELQSSDEEEERTAEAASMAVQQQQVSHDVGATAGQTTTGPPVAVVHGIEWFKSSANSIPNSLNGRVARRQWCIRTPVGEVLVPGRNQTTDNMAPLDFFYSCSHPNSSL
jgi:hypothetical protein